MGDDLKALAASFEMALPIIKELASVVVRKSGMDVVSKGQTRCAELKAVDTGAMMNSIDMDFTENDSLLEAVAGPTTFYAPYVHNGYTNHGTQIAPRPFMADALDMASPAFESAMEQIVEALK